MKYIKLRYSEAAEAPDEIVLFPDSIDHDKMMEVLHVIRHQTPEGNWESVLRWPVSAGFVTSEGICYGRSETLNKKSAPEDSAVLNKQYNKG